MAGIAAFGAYLPRLRLQRGSVTAAHAWFAPGLKALGKGERSFASWDEDSVTMAVEAARDCLEGHAREDVKGLFLASTTAPFADRQNAGIVKEALTLEDDTATLDLGGSQRAGLAALIQALRSARAGPILCVASEMRRPRPASEAELNSGDGAAALLVVEGEGLARHVADHTVSVDFVDHVREAGRDFDYTWEARWIREEGLGKIAPQAIRDCLAKAGIAGERIDHFILPSPMRGAAEMVAKASGIPAKAVRDTLSATIGDTGTAHALLMLAHTLETARPEELLLVAAFGSGCETLLLQRTEAPSPSPRLGVSGWIARRRPEANYTRYLVLAGLLDIERGMRAELDLKQPLTALWRERKTVLGLVGGRCTTTGTVQFPRSRISVNPNEPAVDTQQEYRLAERPARILTFTADALAYSPDPPLHYGMIEFAEGGRMNAEFCDIETEDVEVGREMRMMFRIKSFDETRGFRRYFWKAAPHF